MFALVACLAAYITDWLWYTPPAKISNDDRMGFARDQVLNMGIKEFAMFEHDNHDEPTRRDSIAHGVDGPNIVFGACLAEANNEQIEKLSKPEQTRFRALRDSLWRFGMATIALGNC